MFSQSFNGKRVLVTGHTGFKGSWLCLWLESLGAEVFGLSDGFVSEPNHFEALDPELQVTTKLGDVSEPGVFKEFLNLVQPDFVFHMAAQPLVRRSYAEPYLTMKSNIMGTTLVLDALREYSEPCTAVIITSDKAYENIEMVYGYREDDRLGGADPYSASKGAAEIVASAYLRSFLNAKDNLRIGIARAGNVIGGGDWASDRLVPDIIRAWQQKQTLTIRSPKATRPWQHVLEPLSGYLHLASLLASSDSLDGEAFNFGPPANAVHPVVDIVEVAEKKLSGLEVEIVPNDDLHEAGLLKLCCDKAETMLNWSASLEFSETAELTLDWYSAFYGLGSPKIESAATKDLSLNQLDDYVERARAQQQEWTN